MDKEEQDEQKKKKLIYMQLHFENWSQSWLEKKVKFILQKVINFFRATSFAYLDSRPLVVGHKKILANNLCRSRDYWLYKNLFE